MTEHARGAGDGRDALLAERFVALADTLVDDFDLVDLLDRLVRTCVELLEVSAAGLLIVDRGGQLQPVAASTETTRVLELFQLQNDEGPCLECVRTGVVVAVPDIDAEVDRWPLFSQAARVSGFRSVYALPMRLRRDTVGSLNLFIADSHEPLPDNHQLVAQALADVATIGILQHRTLQRSTELAEQLQAALDTRIVIEQAKGVLAEFGGVGMADAFEALRRHARGGGVKIGEAAFRIVQGATPLSQVIAQRRPT
ncbi:MAG: GAF and ANTAR domain-containing protein [Nocardioides sp.]